MQDESTALPDVNDRATQEEEFAIELRTRDRERKLIRKIEQSIEAIQNEDYGFCETCGIEIGLRRLEARPTATLCIDCKTFGRNQRKAKQRIILTTVSHEAKHSFALRGKAMLCLIAAHTSDVLHPPHRSTALWVPTAVASYCDAKANHGKWLVRIEDTDIARIYPHSEAHILSCIDAFQFEPDAEIIFQKDCFRAL